MSFTNYNQCSLLLPLDGVNNGTTFTDWSVTPKTITRVGTPITSTSSSKYYGSSTIFDGIDDYLTVPDSADLDLSGDFTIAVWVNPGVISSQVQPFPNFLCKGTYQLATGVWAFILDRSNGSASFQFSNPAVTLVLGTLTDNTWSHLAITRVGSTLYRFFNGTLIATSTSSIDFSSTYVVSLGASSTGSSDFKGNLQDVLIMKGVALWTASFTPTRLVGQLDGVVKDKDDVVAARGIRAHVGRNVSSFRTFTTTSSAIDGTYSLRVPATEVTRIALANETELYNDIVDRIVVE